MIGRLNRFYIQTIFHELLGSSVVFRSAQLLPHQDEAHCSCLPVFTSVDDGGGDGFGGKSSRENWPSE
ncbi:hypothetical protein TYRP_007462 [Tyrophagus putrescentiae]|nr:hypothetical protein TYRP_007462 [Tyrophagus putrescentiae]